MMRSLSVAAAALLAACFAPTFDDTVCGVVETCPPDHECVNGTCRPEGSVPRVTLTVASAGDGAGVVRSEPAGIDCGPSCAEEYWQGTTVTLTATPADGSRFDTWSGGGCTGPDPCTVIVSEDTTVTATFARDRAELTSIQLFYAGALVPDRLVPSFSPGITSYAVDVGLGMQRLEVAVTPREPTATVTVGGAPVVSGVPSDPIALNLGTTSIPVVVTVGSDRKTYTLAVTRASTVLQQAYAKASNAGANDQFGTAVALSGDTLVVGAKFEASAATGVGGDQLDNSATLSGAVYVFSRTGGGWTQQAYLKASNTGAGDGFGTSVALSGDTLAVGAVLEDSAAIGTDGNQADDSAIDSGAVYVFTRTGGTWSQQAYLKASNTNAGDRFGTSLALSGGTLAVSAENEDSGATGINGSQADNSAPDSGAVYVFTQTSGTWVQRAYLKASNAQAGDKFGHAVALWGNTLAVSAYLEDSAASGVGGNQADDSAPNSGAVYVFTGNAWSWSQQAYLKASNPQAGDIFGNSIALWGDSLAVGAPGEDSVATGVGGDQQDNGADHSGAAYVFTRMDPFWSQQAYVKASNTGAGDMFGVAVALCGDLLAVTAYQEGSAATGIDGNGADDTASLSGAAYVYGRSGSTWLQGAYVKASNTGAGDYFGASVAVWGDTLAVGAFQEASAASGIDGNQADNTALKSGAVYIIR